MKTLYHPCLQTSLKPKINQITDWVSDKWQAAKSKASSWIPVGLSFYLNGLFYIAATTELGKGITKASDSIVDEIVAVYCGSLFYFLLIINVLVLAFSKNDKVTGIARKTLIFIVVAFLVCKYIEADKLDSTMTTVSGWLTN